MILTQLSKRKLLYGGRRTLTVGHIPREISRFAFFFLRHRGTIKGHVVDLQQKRSPIPQGGLEIRLKLKFEHTNVAVVEVMKEKLARYNYEFDENNINHQADIVSYSSAEENEPENE